jgi:glycosyltransferase involved in cell wall biosynthesis
MGKFAWLPLKRMEIKPTISAYVPCFNNASTLRETIESIRKLTVPVDELFLVDDGSTDNSIALAEQLGVRIIRHAQNLGRGAVRARAMQEAKHDFVLSCDATNALPPDFAERALTWFESPNVAAVFGRIWQEDRSTAVLRWRGRHLFKMDVQLAANHRASLTTYGVLIRKSHVLAVGSFNPNLRHSEDADLGERLLAAGHEVVFDPGLKVMSRANNTLGEVLERYWRWYAGKNEQVTWRGYGKQVVYSLKVMARRDWHAGDPLGLPISLLSPHYQFWKSFWRRLRPSSE